MTSAEFRYRSYLKVIPDIDDTTFREYDKSFTVAESVVSFHAHQALVVNKLGHPEATRIFFIQVSSDDRQFRFDSWELMKQAVDEISGKYRTEENPITRDELIRICATMASYTIDHV